MQLRSRSFFQATLLALLSFLMAACSEKAVGPAETLKTVEQSAPKSNEAASPISVQSYQLEKLENGQLMLTGNGKNMSDNVVGKAEAVFKLFDGDGKEIGETSAVVTNLAPQFGWLFQAPIADKTVTTVKLKEISISN